MSIIIKTQLPVGAVSGNETTDASVSPELISENSRRLAMHLFSFGTTVFYLINQKQAVTRLLHSVLSTWKKKPFVLDAAIPVTVFIDSVSSNGKIESRHGASDAYVALLMDMIFSDKDVFVKWRSIVDSYDSIPSFLRPVVYMFEPHVILRKFTALSKDNKVWSFGDTVTQQTVTRKSFVGLIHRLWFAFPYQYPRQNITQAQMLMIALALVADIWFFTPDMKTSVSDLRSIMGVNPVWILSFRAADYAMRRARAGDYSCFNRLINSVDDLFSAIRACVRSTPELQMHKRNTTQNHVLSIARGKIMSFASAESGANIDTQVIQCINSLLSVSDDEDVPAPDMTGAKIVFTTEQHLPMNNRTWPFMKWTMRIMTKEDAKPSSWFFDALVKAIRPKLMLSSGHQCILYPLACAMYMNHEEGRADVMGWVAYIYGSDINTATKVREAVIAAEKSSRELCNMLYDKFIPHVLQLVLAQIDLLPQESRMEHARKLCKLLLLMGGCTQVTFSASNPERARIVKTAMIEENELSVDIVDACIRNMANGSSEIDDAPAAIYGLASHMLTPPNIRFTDFMNILNDFMLDRRYYVKPTVLKTTDSLFWTPELHARIINASAPSSERGDKILRGFTAPATIRECKQEPIMRTLAMIESMVYDAKTEIVVENAQESTKGKWRYPIFHLYCHGTFYHDDIVLGTRPESTADNDYNSALVDHRLTYGPASKNDIPEYFQMLLSSCHVEDGDVALFESIPSKVFSAAASVHEDNDESEDNPFDVKFWDF